MNFMFGLTFVRIFLMFFLGSNLCSLSPLLTTLLEKRTGFTLAFALPLIVFLIGFSIFYSIRKRLVSAEPQSHVLLDASKVIWIAIRNKGDFNAARPSSETSQQDKSRVTWSDEFVDELASTLWACRLFLLFPLYFMAWVQMGSNFVSQARTMESHGLPNDVLFNLDPLATIVLVPTFEFVLYPYLRKRGISFNAIQRIWLGFIIMSLGMFYAAAVQLAIYHAPPCYSRPLAKDCMGGKVPNRVHIASQAPAYLLVALSEILAAPSGYQYAFEHAPENMKSIVMSFFTLAVAVGAFLAMAVNPFIQDPNVAWVYGILGVETMVAGVVLHLWFRERRAD